MGIIIGKHYTPQDEQGNRDVIHPETQVDAVLDPVTGVPLRDQLGDITKQLKPVNIEAGKDGFITAEKAAEYDRMAANAIVVDSVKPSFAKGGFWYNVYDPGMTTSDIQ